MGLNLDAVGRSTAPVERSWTSSDALLYALGVGAGTAELAFTTENSDGVIQQVLPTMAVVIGVPGGIWDLLGEVDMGALVHGEQSVELHRPIPVEGRARSVTTVTAIFDKGSAAVVELTTDTADAASGEPMFSTRSSMFIRGAGGWGGDRGPSRRDTTPDRTPDEVVEMATLPQQALLYRLSGDRNPLHSDPTFATRAGFERPILHGLCTYGFTGRALLASVCDGDPARFGAMEARFSAPVLPGDELVVRIWSGDEGAAFETRRGDGTAVITGGRFTPS